MTKDDGTCLDCKCDPEEGPYPCMNKRNKPEAEFSIYFRHGLAWFHPLNDAAFFQMHLRVDHLIDEIIEGRLLFRTVKVI